MNVREPVTLHRARMLALAGVVTFFALWCLLSYADLVPTVILPSPTEVIRAFPVLHFEDGANHAGAVVHDAQPHTATFRYVRRKTYPIIVHHEHHAAFAPHREHDRDLQGFAMLDGIVDGFLHDTIQVHGHGMDGAVSEDGHPDDQPDHQFHREFPDPLVGIADHLARMIA